MICVYLWLNWKWASPLGIELFMRDQRGVPATLCLGCLGCADGLPTPSGSVYVYRQEDRCNYQNKFGVF
jgi:hypothetical protein